MEDIAPELLEQLRTRFSEKISVNPKIRALYKRIQSGDANYADAEEYAYLVGEALSKTFRELLSSAVLPDGRMYYNIADRVIWPLLEEDHSLIADAARTVQTALNEKAGIGIKAQSVAVNTDRIDGIINKISGAENFDDIAWILDEPVKNFSMNVVDEILRANVDFQGRAGLRPRIIRKAERKCCEWCSQLAGEYDYPVDREVYRRHERCRCTVEYDPGTGKRQNVYTKKWTEPEKSAKIKARKSAGLLSYSKRAFEPDIFIPAGVGAKQKDTLVRLPNGDRVRLTPGSRITNVQTIAGLGRNRQIDIVDVLVYKYPDTDPEKWQKKKGIGYVDYDGESYRSELHWYEEPSVGRVEFKIKPDADGNWFYEDE